VQGAGSQVELEGEKQKVEDGRKMMWDEKIERLETYRRPMKIERQET
jgi:hypothetical protein